MGTVTLVTGGARAGKTAFALALGRAYAGPVTYLATAEAGDAEMARRIAVHRAERPVTWRTIEAPLEVTGALAAARAEGLVILDCLTLWTSNLLLRDLPADGFAAAEAEAALATVLRAVEALLAWQLDTDADLVAVTNEVGLGVVPPTPLGRLYQDALGRVNQRMAAAATRVYLVVAGIPVELRALAAATTRDAPPM